MGRGKKLYSEKQISAGIKALVLHGGSQAGAAKYLAENGFEISANTLGDWKNSVHRDKYLRLSDHHAKDLEEQIVADLRATIVQAQTGERMAIDNVIQNLPAVTDAVHASTIARNMAVIKGVTVDKYLTITGRPSSINLNVSMDELVSKARRLMSKGGSEEPPKRVESVVEVEA